MLRPCIPVEPVCTRHILESNRYGLGRAGAWKLYDGARMVRPLLGDRQRVDLHAYGRRRRLGPQRRDPEGRSRRAEAACYRTGMDDVVRAKGLEDVMEAHA